jgi:hypothetical protein
LEPRPGGECGLTSQRRRQNQQRHSLIAAASVVRQVLTEQPPRVGGRTPTDGSEPRLPPLRDRPADRLAMVSPSLVGQRDHQAFAQRLGVADQGLDAGIAALAGLELPESGPAHGGQAGEVRNAMYL